MQEVAEATTASTVQNIAGFSFNSSIFPFSFSPFVSSKRRMSHQAC